MKTSYFSADTKTVSRRRFLRYGLACTMAAAPWSRIPAARAATVTFGETRLVARRALLDGYRRTLIAMQQQSRLPVIDVEHHWGSGNGRPKFLVADLLARMDRNGVALTWLGVNELMGSKASITECAKAPERLVPTIMHGDGPLACQGSGTAPRTRFGRTIGRVFCHGRIRGTPLRLQYQLARHPYPRQFTGFRSDLSRLRGNRAPLSPAP